MTTITAEQQPVTLITTIESEPAQQAEALEVLRQRARFMSTQPGFVSISLHRSSDGRRLVNYVQWRSREQLQAAHAAPEFRKHWEPFGEVTASIDPHLYEVVEVFESP